MRRQPASSQVLRRVEILPDGTAADFAWLRMRKFRNADRLSSLLIKQRGMPSKHRNNVKKQMQQLGYCLVQAKEYYDASREASLATRPLHLYYCCMSLALAEILCKGDGNASIDKLRADHSHHGLEMVALQRIPPSLEESASLLRAKQFVTADRSRVGTFEVWHRYPRHLPLIGKQTLVLEGGRTQSGPRIIFTSRDHRPRFLPDRGVTFLDCIASLPGMRAYILPLGARSRLVRAKISQSIDQRADTPFSEHEIIIQPNDDDLIERLQENFKFDPNAVDRITYYKFKSGFSVNWMCRPGIDEVSGEIPDGFTVSQEEVCFLEHDPPLNEFGQLYVVLYMLGMLSRYYPDLWHKEIENSTDLSIAAEYLLDVASQRLPVLAMGELESTYFLTR